MRKDEYNPPRITRREAVEKFSIVGLGRAGAETQMAVSPIEEESPESPGSDSPTTDSPSSPESPDSPEEH